MGKLVNKLFTPNKPCSFLYSCIHCCTSVMCSIPLYFKNIGATCPNWFKLSSFPSDKTQPDCVTLYCCCISLSLCICLPFIHPSCLSNHMRNQVWIQVRSETSFYFFTHKMKMAIKQQQQQSKKKKTKKWRWQQLFLRLVSFKWACSKCLTYFCLHLLFGLFDAFFFSCPIIVSKAMLRIYQMFNFLLALITPEK